MLAPRCSPSSRMPLPVPGRDELERVVRRELDPGALDERVDVPDVDELRAAVVGARAIARAKSLVLELGGDADDLARLDVGADRRRRGRRAGRGRCRSRGEAYASGQRLGRQIPADRGDELRRRHGRRRVPRRALAAGQIEVAVEVARLLLRGARRAARARWRRAASGCRCPGAAACATGRGRARSGRARSRRAGRPGAIWSITSTRPPSRVTRASSETTSSGRATWCSVRWQAARSKASALERERRRVALDERDVRRARPRRCAAVVEELGRRRRARRPRATSGARASASAPVPAPESRTRSSPASGTNCAQLLAQRLAPAALALDHRRRRAREPLADALQRAVSSDKLERLLSGRDRACCALLGDQLEQRADLRARRQARARRRGGAARPGRRRATRRAASARSRRPWKASASSAHGSVRGGSGGASAATSRPAASCRSERDARSAGARARSAAGRASPGGRRRAGSSGESTAPARSASSSEPPSGSQQAELVEPPPAGDAAAAGAPRGSARRRARDDEPRLLADQAARCAARSRSRARPRSGPRAAGAADRPRTRRRRPRGRAAPRGRRARRTDRRARRPRAAARSR